MKILVKTLFDCSATGTTGNFRPSQLPHRDRTDSAIHDHRTWSRSRNKQRNLETLLQVFGLRSQLENVSEIQCQDDAWQFTFEVDNPAVYGDADSLYLLLQDCEGVPMLTDLDEKIPIKSVLSTQGQDQNIWFTPINT
jgi:hypothetical protein